MPRDGLVNVDASTFAKQLVSLAETIALKVDREGAHVISAPRYVFEDMFVQLRYAQQAFALILYLNADERRNEDCYWREQYSILTLPAIRTLIDCFYNITLVLEDPISNGERFRLSGLKKFLLNLEEDMAKYGADPAWAKHLSMRETLSQNIAREANTTVEKVRGSKVTWETLGRYLANSFKNSNEHQSFLRSLTLGSWGDYSALAHATFEGMIPHGIYFIRDALPQERRSELRENFLQFVTMHIARASAILLSMLTEVQVKFRFVDAARIDERMLDMWDALLPFYEVKEFYESRYRELLLQHKISRS